MPQLRGNFRLGVWCLLCILTLLIFLYPAHLNYQYAIIQSLDIFPHLQLFSILFTVWFGMILALLFFRERKQRVQEWENIALLGIFILVFSGIWVSLTDGNNGEYLAYAAQAKNIVDMGRVPGVLQSISTTDFPGLPLLLSGIRLVTGFETSNGMFVLLILNMLLYSTFLYLLFRCLVKDPFLASLGTLIVIIGVRETAQFIPNFHPRGFALVLFSALLVLLFSKYRQPNGGRIVSNVVLFIILFAALTITHLVTALVFIIILMSIYLLGRYSKKNLIEFPLVTLCTITILTWLTYFAISTDTSLVNIISTNIRDLFGTQIVSSYLVNMTSSYFGAVGTPVWVDLIRYFWLALVLAPGSIVALINLFKVRNLSQMDIALLGGVVGLGIFVVLTLIESGLVEGFRALFYLPLFSVPIIFGFLSIRGNFVKRFVPAILLVIILALSVPTFLVHNDRVGIAAIYPQEISTSKFLSSCYGNGEALNIVGDSSTDRQILLDMPEANYESFLSYTEENEDQVWSGLALLVKDFESPGESYNNSLFLYSGRLASNFTYLFRVDPTSDPKWQLLNETLNQNSLIYNNGMMEVYYTKVGNNG